MIIGSSFRPRKISTWQLQESIKYELLSKYGKTHMYLQMGHIVAITIQGERTNKEESQNQNESEE